MTKETILKLIAGISIALFIFMGVNWQNERDAHQFDKRISDSIVKKQYERYTADSLQAVKKVKESEARYDSIYVLHIEFEQRYKRNTAKLQNKLYEITNLNILTRANYVDSVLRAAGRR